jgi:hypothetical protein
MAAMAAIFYLVSIDYLTNACFFVAHWGLWIFTMYLVSLSLIFHTPTDNFPLGGHMPHLALPLFCFAISG